jgi:hypothetical protein
MRRRITLVLAAAVAAVTALTVAPPPGSAATVYTYFGQAGGTQIQALGTLIRSDLTAESHLLGNKIPASASNPTAGVNVPGLARVGAIGTNVDSAHSDAGDTITSKAEIANVSLLNGVIRAQALTTSATATHDGDELSGSGDTRVVGLKVGSIKVPIDVAPNTTIKVGNLASVVINEQKTTRVGDKIIQDGSALKVTLLRPRGKAPVGATITVNPVRAAWGPSIPPKSPALGGNAFGALAKVKVTSVEAVSGPVAYTQLPPFGTYGQPIVNSTARFSLPGVLRVGAVESISQATSVPLTADVSNSNEVARLNLLNGVISASAIKVVAHANLDAEGNVTVDGHMDTVHLKIGGNTIPIDVAPNTTIEIPNVLKVVINEQIVSPNGRRIDVTGLHITLLKPAGDLGVGADIRIASATSLIY